MKKLSPETKKIIKRLAKQTAEHFRKDKWDLDYSFLIHDLFVSLLGYNPEVFYVQTISDILKKQLSLKLEGVNSRTKLGLFKRGKKNENLLSPWVRPTRRLGKRNVRSRTLPPKR